MHGNTCHPKLIKSLCQSVRMQRSIQLKPSPWLYAETARVGLGIPFEKRHKAIGVEDSAAGVASIKLAGFSCVGISGGNIEQAEMSDMCDYKINNLVEMLDIVL